MRLFVILAAAASALAQALTVNTPQGVLACQNYQIGFVGGTAPYTLLIQPGGDTSAAALEIFQGVTGTSYTWKVIEPANTQLFIRILDSLGVKAESGIFTVQASGQTCTAAATTPAGTDSTVAGATTPVATTPAATTPVATTPVATTPAPSNGNGNSSGAASSTRATTSSSSTGGASTLQIAGGLVGLVGAVAVALA